MKLSTLALATAALALAGCSTYDTEHHGSAVQIEPAHNFLGLVKTSPGSYSNNENAIVTVTTGDLWARRDYSGDSVTMLWGAITINDF